MAVRRVGVSGDAPVELAWQRYVEIGRWPSWSPQIRWVEASAERLAVGVTGTVHTVGGVRVAFTVTAVDAEERSWTWIARLGPLALTLSHEVHATAGGSWTSLLMEGPRLVLLGYAPLVGMALRRLVSR